MNKLIVINQPHGGRNLDKIGFHSQDTSELFFQDAEIVHFQKMVEI